MKSVLISIQPKWCELIASGKKTVEIRKTRPKIETPFKVYIYCTKDNAGLIPSRYWWKADKTGFQHILNGKVIGEFVCVNVDRISHCGTRKDNVRLVLVDENLCIKELNGEYYKKTQLNYSEIDEYSNGGDAYGWHISNLVIYDKPKDLSEFTGLRKTKFGYEPIKITRPPQSWCYVEGNDNNER